MTDFEFDVKAPEKGLKNLCSVLCTHTSLRARGSDEGDDRLAIICFLQMHQQRVQKSYAPNHRPNYALIATLSTPTLMERARHACTRVRTLHVLYIYMSCLHVLYIYMS